MCVSEWMRVGEVGLINTRRNVQSVDSAASIISPPPVAMLSATASYRVLTGACNPMLCPIHVSR